MIFKKPLTPSDGWREIKQLTIWVLWGFVVVACYNMETQYQAENFKRQSKTVTTTVAGKVWQTTQTTNDGYWQVKKMPSVPMYDAKAKKLLPWTNSDVMVTNWVRFDGKQQNKKQ